MRFLSVTVKNVRMHEDLTVAFDRSRTVIAGPNEAGKSTLVEAIERVLFYPHRSTAGNLDGLRPRAGGGHPEVTLRFEKDGHTYEIHKVFKGQQALARFTDADGTTRTSDEAESRLREVLGFGTEQLAKPFHGWSHLWARQGSGGDDPTSRDALGTAAKGLDARLKQLTGTAPTESKKDTATYDRIAAEYLETHTPSGKVKKGSRLASATDDLAAARKAVADAADRLAELESAADAVVQEDARIREEQELLDDAKRRMTELKETLERIDGHEKTLAIQQAAASSADKAHAALQAGDALIADLTKSITARTDALAPQEREVERLKTHEQKLHDSVASSLTAMNRAVEAQGIVAAEKDLLEAVAAVFALETERATLEQTRERIAIHKANIAASDRRLAALPDVDQATVDELERLSRRLEVGEGRLEASATRLELLRAGDAVAVDGRSITAGEPHVLTTPAEVTIGDGTTLRITPGGGDSMLELMADVAKLRKDQTSLLNRLGVKDVAEAKQTLEKRLAEQSASERLREKIDELDAERVHTRLEEIAARLQKLEGEIDRKITDGFQRPADAAAVTAAIASVQERRDTADEAVHAAHDESEKASQELKHTRTSREALEEALRDERGELDTLRTQKAGLESVHGTDRQAALQQLAADKLARADEVAATEQTLEALGPANVRSDYERYEIAVQNAMQAISDAKVRRARAEEALTRSGTTDPHASMAAATAQLELAMRQHAEINRRVQAVALLRNLFEQRRHEEAELVAAPLRTKVKEYLSALFGSGAQVAVTKSADTFQDLAVARPSVGGLPFAFQELSGGTQEQVAATCRLAMAEVLAGGDDAEGAQSVSGLPMVFDDAFVNSDPDRVEAVQRVLYLAAQRGLQIIVLSCNPRDYASFAAKRVDLPPPKGGGAA